MTYRLFGNRCLSGARWGTPVNLSDFSRVTDRWLSVNAELWAWSVLLGNALGASNNQKRSQKADRGDSTNLGVSQAGAFGELLLHSLVRKMQNSDLDCRYIAKHLFMPGGGAEAEGPDLQFAEDDTKAVIGVDSKTFSNLYNPRYKYFAINAKKHDELRGLCSFYFCLCFAARSKSVAVAKLVPYGDVDRWQVGDL
jgi:hypothetical protein